MFSALRRFTIGLALVGQMSLAIPAIADSPFSEIVVFGDSLSDTGNVFLARGGEAVGPPYYEGRFSNGPVWVEVLANELGLSASTPSLLGGCNYAWGGAETGPGLSFFETPNVSLQVDLFLADRGGLVGDELVVLLAGGTTSPGSPPTPPPLWCRISSATSGDLRRPVARRFWSRTCTILETAT